MARIIKAYSCPLCGSTYGNEADASRCLAACEREQAQQAKADPVAVGREQLKAEVLRGIEEILAGFREDLQRAAELEVLSRKPYLRDHEVERLFGIPASTLRTKRSRGGGPAFIKDGDRVIYTPQAIRQYLENRKVKVHVHD